MKSTRIEDNTDPRFTTHRGSVEEFNKEFEELMKKYNFKGIVLGVTNPEDGEKEGEKVCAGFANSELGGSSMEQKMAIVEVFMEVDDKIMKKLKIMKLLERLTEDCDCEDCRSEEEDTDDNGEEPQEVEEDPRAEVDRENAQAAMDR